MSGISTSKAAARLVFPHPYLCVRARGRCHLPARPWFRHPGRHPRGATAASQVHSAPGCTPSCDGCEVGHYGRSLVRASRLARSVRRGVTRGSVFAADTTFKICWTSTLVAPTCCVAASVPMSRPCSMVCVLLGRCLLSTVLADVAGGCGQGKPPWTAWCLPTNTPSVLRNSSLRCAWERL